MSNVAKSKQTNGAEIRFFPLFVSLYSISRVFLCALSPFVYSILIRIGSDAIKGPEWVGLMSLSSRALQVGERESDRQRGKREKQSAKFQLEPKI